MSFQLFWNAYGIAYGAKVDRMGAERVWKRMTYEDRCNALAGIASYREACQQQGINMMLGRNYLSHRRWEDEYATKKEQSSTLAQPVDVLADMETW